MVHCQSGNLDTETHCMPFDVRNSHGFSIVIECVEAIIIYYIAFNKAGHETRLFTDKFAQ